MSRRIAVIGMFILAALAGPSLFACEDCPDFENCVEVDFGALTCKWDNTGHCFGSGFCPPSGVLSLQAQYRVAVVRVIDPNGKPLPKAQPQPNAAPVLAAAR